MPGRTRGICQPLRGFAGLSQREVCHIHTGMYNYIYNILYINISIYNYVSSMHIYIYSIKYIYMCVNKYQNIDLIYIYIDISY